jgi:hypothetical protein
VAQTRALPFATGHAAHAASAGTLFARGAAGVGVQGWHAVKRLRAGVGISKVRYLEQQREADSEERYACARLRSWLGR